MVRYAARKTDRDFIRALKSFLNITEVAKELRVSRKTVYNRKASLLRRYRDARRFVNWFEANTRDPELRKILKLNRSKREEEEDEM